MTEEQRAELEKLARAATPGEWKTAATDDSLVLCGRNKIAGAFPQPGDDWGYDNAAYIAAANPATVLNLLATIARLEAEKVKDGKALEFIAEGHDVGRHDGLPEDGPAHDADTIFAVARARLSSRAKDQSQ